MRGGARSRSGPAPDPNALRRDRDKQEWTHLPAAGRTTPAPEWPLSRQTKREAALWEREWRRPQALMWEANGQETEVALYVRALRTAEQPKAPTAARSLVCRQMAELGISVPGLRSNRWIIADEEARQPQVARAAGMASARDRLRLVVGE